MAMAGGVALIVCVPPVTLVLAVVEQEEVANGQKVTIHVEPGGKIALFEGMLRE
jgi:hypothetical protein